MSDKTYLLAAESEAEMEDWIKVLDKVRTAAETLSQISMDRQKGMSEFPDMSRLVRKPTMWFPNRSDTNRPVQLQKQARSLKFGVK